MQRTLSVAHHAVQMEIEAAQQQVAGSGGGHRVASHVLRYAAVLGEFASCHANDGGLWLRVGLAVAGGTFAFMVARRLRTREVHDRSKRWRESEHLALKELRFASQAGAIPCSPILVSESQTAAHRGYR